MLHLAAVVLQNILVYLHLVVCVKTILNLIFREVNATNAQEFPPRHLDVGLEQRRAVVGQGAKRS